MPKIPTNPNDGPLVIRVGWDWEGAVYVLHPWTKRRVQQAFPQARMIPKVFLAYEKKEDFETLHGPYLQIVGAMLTGLTVDQIAQLGGLRIIEAVEESVVWEWRPTLSRAQ
jgi:hypothetical protein